MSDTLSYTGPVAADVRHPEAFSTVATPAEAKARPPFRPDIEGLRGIAVLLVVLYHAAVPGFTGGYVGVDVFFVLSGYLITWLLVREVEKNGRVDLPGFYARRARRLLPAMGVLLVAIMGFALLAYSPKEQELIAATAFSTATYLSNVFFAFNATDYLAGAAEANPLLHTWSLAVEEQFYLFWPLLVVAALTLFGRRAPSRRRLLWTMAGAIVVSFGLTLFLQKTLNGHWAFFSSPTRAWEFAVGGLGVLLPLGPSRRLRTVGGWAGLAAMLAAGMLYTARTPFPGWAALLPAVGTVLVLRACALPDGTSVTDTPLARVLGVRPLQELGRLSYSWYLWHWPVLVFAAGLEFTEIHRLSPGYRAALALLSLALAEASYRLVENPVRHQKWLAAVPRRGLALGLMLTLLGAGASFGWKEMAQHDMNSPQQVRYTAAVDDRIVECRAEIRSEELTECLRGDTSASTTIILFGDSHAHQWLPAVEQIAQQEGWRVVTLFKSGCPVVFEPKFNVALGRTYVECEVWQQKAIQRIGEIKPALIVASSLVGSSFEGAELKRGLDKAFRQLSETGSPVLYLRDTPYPGFNVPDCLGRASQPLSRWIDKGCTYALRDEASDNVYRLQSEAASRFTNIQTLDVTGSICDTPRCAVERDGRVIFRDHSHLTASFARSLAPLLAPHLKARLGQPEVDA